MLFTVAGMKVAINWSVYGWIDLRKGPILEVLLIPLALSLIVWFACRRLARP